MFSGKNCYKLSSIEKHDYVSRSSIGNKTFWYRLSFLSQINHRQTTNVKFFFNSCFSWLYMIVQQPNAYDYDKNLIFLSGYECSFIPQALLRYDMETLIFLETSYHRRSLLMNGLSQKVSRMIIIQWPHLKEKVKRKRYLKENRLGKTAMSIEYS